MPKGFGVMIPIAESVVQEIGEAEAWRIASEQADHIAARHSSTLTPLPGTAYSQNFPFSDPETGKEMEPFRGYRFTYIEALDA